MSAAIHQVPPFAKGGLGGIKLLTDHLDLWAAADTEKKSGRGRSSGNADRVYGIKKLRELILELAVRGKLVPQDPNDEPASVLLKRIQAEKTKLIAEGKIKKDKPLASITEDEKPFELPHGWVWTRVAQVGHDWGQKAPDSDFTYIEVSAIDSQRGIVSSPELVKPENAPSRARKVVKKGSVIYSTIRPYLLNVAVIEDDFSPEPIASTAFAIVHPFCVMPPRYFLCFFRSPVFVRHVESVQMGIAYPAINDGQFFSSLIPLPPIEEQHRIVAKVDELMALCDQLEQQQTHSIEAHQTLVETLLGTLTRVESQQEFSAAWARIASHFATLSTTEASIDVLKQTILQLAVMGKLVPQDPNDEPASGLLERIAEEKGRLVKEGILKKQQSLTEVTDAEMPFEIPDKWEWSRLGNLGIGNTGKTPSTGNPEYYGGVIPFIGPGQITPDGEILDSDKNLTEKGCEYSAVAELGDVLMVCIGGSIGKSAITVSMIAFNQQINSIRPVLVNPLYLNHSMNTPSFQAAVLEKATGSATPIINRSKWEELLVPLPPEAEQHRIVAKVDELMSLCDTLKARLADAQAIQLHLADAVVEQAVC